MSAATTSYEVTAFCELSLGVPWSIHLSWDHLWLQDCAAGDCNHSGIQHQESQDQGPQRLEGDISYRLHYKHYSGSCDCNDLDLDFPDAECQNDCNYLQHNLVAVDNPKKDESIG